MARRSSRGSVYNKRSNERVQSAQTGGGGGGGYSVKVNQAHAQSAQNPTQDRQVQHQQQSNDPWARATQFVSNVGRGAADTGRSYTTDFYDMGEAALTGKEQKERSYQDETLAGVFGRGLFEGNLHGAVDEAGRRITHEPGRVVGEVAAETAIMIGSMGFGAALKGAKIGATAIKSTTKGVVTHESRTGFGGASLLDTKKFTLRAGQQQKTIGNKYTTVRSQRGNNKWKEKTKKTTLFDRIELAGIAVGEKQAKLTRTVSPRLADKLKMGRAVGDGTKIPLIKGASGLPPSSIDDVTGNAFSILSGSNIASANIAKNVATPAVKKGLNIFSNMSPTELAAGKLLQDQQFEAGKLAHVSGITKQSGLFEGVPAPGLGDTLGGSFYMRQPGMQGPVQPAVRGNLDFIQPTKIGGTGDNFSSLKTSTLDSEDIATHGREYIDRETGTWKTDVSGEIITYGTRTKLKPDEERVAQTIIQEMKKKIMANKGIAAARERPKKVFMKDERGDGDYAQTQKMVGNDTPAEFLGGSPSSIMYDKVYAIDAMTDEVYRVLSQQSSAGVGTVEQARAGALKVIKFVEAENVLFKAQTAKEAASVGPYPMPPGVLGPPAPRQTISQLGVLGSATPNANDALQKMTSLNLNARQTYTGIDEIGSRVQDGLDMIAVNYMSGRGANIKALLPKGLLVESDMSGGVNSIGQQRLDRFGGSISSRGDGTVKNNYSEATKELVEQSDGVIAFFDGEAGIGTQLALDTAKKNNIPTISNPTSTQLSEWAELGLVRKPAIVGTRGSRIKKPKALKPGMQGPLQPFEDRVRSSLAGLVISKSDKFVPEVSGMVYGPYGKPDSKIPFDAAKSEIWYAGGGVPDEGATKVGKDFLNDGPVANLFTTPGDLLASTNRGSDLVTDRALLIRGVPEGKKPIFSAKETSLYKDIREAKVGKHVRARTPDKDRMAMPDTLEGYALEKKLTIKEAKNMLFTLGQGGTNMDVYAQIGISQDNLRPFNALWEAGKQGPLKETARYKKGAVFDGVEMVEGTTPTVDVQSPWLLRPVTPVQPRSRITPDMLDLTDIKAQNQQSFIQGDTSVLGKTKWTGDVDEIPNLTKSQIKQAIPTKQFVIDETERLTDPVEDVESILHSMRFEQGGPPPTMTASNFFMGKPKTSFGNFGVLDLGMNNKSWMQKVPKGKKPKTDGKLYKKVEELKKARKNKKTRKFTNVDFGVDEDNFVRTQTDDGFTFTTKKKNQSKSAESLWTMFGKMGQPTGGGDTTRVGGGRMYDRPIGPIKPGDSRPFQSNPVSYGWGVDFGSNTWGSGSGVPVGTKTSPTQIPLGGNNARVPPSQNFSPRPNWTEQGWDKLGPLPKRTNESKKGYDARMRSLGYLPRA
jgi:hypothetical protein